MTVVRVHAQLKTGGYVKEVTLTPLIYALASREMRKEFLVKLGNRYTLPTIKDLNSTTKILMLGFYPKIFVNTYLRRRQ